MRACAARVLQRPYPQPERGPCISPTGKGPVHIPNRKGASAYPQPERGDQSTKTGTLFE